MGRIWKTVRPIAQSLFGSWALLRMTGVRTTNLISVFFFVLLYVFILYLDQKIAAQEKSNPCTQSAGKRCALVLSCIFTFLYLCGNAEQICSGLGNRGFQLAIIIVTGTGFLILSYKVIRMVCFLFEGKTALRTESVPMEDAAAGTILTTVKPLTAGWERWLFVLTALVCFVCWLPYLLMNLPGIMTVDSMNQFAQVIGIWQASNHHPWIHTMIIKMFYEIGYFVTGNMSQAIIFYTVFQMLFMAVCAAYVMHTLWILKVHRGIRLLVLAFYALVPYNAIFAVTVWKDAMFAGAALLFTAALLRLVYEHRQGEKRKRLEGIWFVYGISGLMLCLFRSNGWYAFLLCTPFLLWTFRKSLRILAPLQCVMIAAVLIIKGPVMDSYGVVQPDLVESLAIPTQQISRVIVQGKELTEEQQAFFERVMDTSQIPVLYNPQVSDGFKRLVRSGDPEYFESHFTDFIRIYLQLGLKYPADYVIAFRDQTIGYWYPDQEGLVAANMGIIENEFGVKDISVWRGKFSVKFQEIQLKLKDIVPGYGLLWSMGSITWWMLFAWFYIGSHQKAKMTSYRTILLPGLAIIATLIIATPVATDFRYAYGYVLCLPIYLILPFLHKGEAVKEEKR